jgi:TRAP-type C4-dicarboxylate transport system permease small subunit
VKDKTEVWLCIVVFIGLMCIGTLNRLYRVSSREGIPMFSIEAVAAGWLYWVGGAIGLVVAGIYYYNTRE